MFSRLHRTEGYQPWQRNLKQFAAWEHGNLEQVADRVADRGLFLVEPRHLGWEVQEGLN